jgi:outer membrane protein TolC
MRFLSKKNLLHALIMQSVALSSIAFALDLEPENVPFEQSKKTRLKMNLGDLIFEASKHNTDILQGELQTGVSRELVAVERNIFEPVFYSTYTHKDIDHKNNAEEATYRSSLNTYIEKSEQYKAGVKGLLPTGARFDIALTGNERESNLIEKTRSYKTEYDNTFAVTLSQPLLRDMGLDITATKGDIAQLNLDIAFHTYQQNVMDATGNVTQAFFRLYEAQKVVEELENSLDIGRKIQSDISAKIIAGFLPSTEKMESEAAMTQREAKLSAAKTTLMDTQSLILSLLDVSISNKADLIFEPLSTVSLNEPAQIPQFDNALQTALEKWPPYLMAQKKLEIENIRVSYLENQELPRLDVLVSNQENGLQKDRFNAMGDAFLGKNNSWNAGVEFEVPILGNRVAQANSQAAQINQRKARLAVDSAKRDLNNNLFAKIEHLKNSQQQLIDAKRNVDLKEQLLKIEWQRLDAGKSNAYTVFKQEEELADSKRRYYATLTELKITQSLVDLITGRLFDKYHIDISRDNSTINLIRLDS